MRRLTTDKEAKDMSMIELAFNACYVKSGQVMYRDFKNELDIRDITKGLLKQYADIDISDYADEDFDDFMIDLLQDRFDGIAGLTALLYRQMWVTAELRERLKEYENAEAVGRLIK